jgi:hypothetical protein
VSCSLSKVHKSQYLFTQAIYCIHWWSNEQEQHSYNAFGELTSSLLTLLPTCIGAKERGELENRVTKMIQEIKDAGNVVLM